MTYDSLNDWNDKMNAAERITALNSRIDKYLYHMGGPGGTLWVENTARGLTLNDGDTTVLIDRHDEDVIENVVGQWVGATA